MILRKFIPLILVITFCSFTGQSQTDYNTVKKIQQYFQEINSDKNLETVSLENNAFPENTSDSECKLTGFFKLGSIEKIDERIGVSSGNRFRAYYFNDNKLIFVYERFETFIKNKDGDGLDHKKTKTTFEGWYYFNNNQIIKQEIYGKRTVENNPPDMYLELNETAKKNIRLLTVRK